MNLTSKQLLVLDFIKRFIASNGYSPTVREITEGLYLKSPSTVQSHLQKLISAGLITTNKRKSRTIELLVQNEYLKTSNKIVSIPVLNEQIDSISTEYLEIPAFMLNNYEPKNLFAFKENNSIYIVNASLTNVGKPSIIIKHNSYCFEENPKDVAIFANVIGKYTFY